MPLALSEDPLRELLLPPAGPWREVECHEEVESTNQVSLEDPRPWRLVAAAHQTRGRGRHARVWETHPGSSVALSMTVPLAPDPGSWGWLPLITGLAVSEALAALTGAPDAFTLKWPNDVLAREPGGAWGKVCGVLCETAPADPRAPGAGMLVVAGVGINLCQDRAELPVSTAMSLALAGLTVPGPSDVVAAVATTFAARHEQWYGGEPGLSALRRAYRAACSTLRREVAVHLPGDQTVTGRAVDVTDSGEILVEDAGSRRAFAAGDVVHVRPRNSPAQA